MVAQPTNPRYLLAVALACACLVRPAASAPQMRHVSQCKLCKLCHLSDKPPEGYTALTSTSYAGTATATAGAATAAGTGAVATTPITSPTTTTARRRLTQRRGKRGTVYDPELDPTVPVHYKPSSYRPRAAVEMAALPECEQCFGCTHNLTLISDFTVFMNNTYASEMGATNSWIFRTQTNATPTGEAVVKVYCLPVPKREGGHLPTCNPLRITEIMKHLMAIDKLSLDCGFTDLIPRMWLAPVLGVVPKVGYPINWWGLWMEYVDGISLENFLYKGSPRRLPMEVIATMFNERLNGTRVLRGAIFDLLTSQCDRHAQNLFLQEDGNLKLIDNESCLQHMWRNCAFDSVLVPTTQKQEIVRLANHYVLKLPTASGSSASPRPFADPQLLLDYRCYLDPPGREELGTDYPPQIGTCLRKVAGMTPYQVLKYYGFPELRVATNLHTRATDMVTYGFEYTAKYGYPRNARPKRYRFQPKCCSLLINKTQFDCGHPWQPSFELPLGNSITGNAWDKDRPDPGSYLGGTFLEDGDVVYDDNSTAPLNIRVTRKTVRGANVAAAGAGDLGELGTRRRRRMLSAFRGMWHRLAM